VDAPTRDALITRYAIAADRILLIPNFVDVERFKARGPLPAKPRRALVFSHYASADGYVPAVQEACRRRSLPVDVLGYGVGRPVRRPEDVLGQYDLVFAKGRAALEALVVGDAVVVCDAFGHGPMITTENVQALRTLDGDYMRWYSPLTVDGLVREIDRYDAADAAELTRWARSVAGAGQAAVRFVELYEEIKREWAAAAPDVIAETQAAAAYLRWLSSHVKANLVERDPLAAFAVRLRNRLTRIPVLSSILLRLSSKIRTRWGAAGGPPAITR
jgi:hypothetical protein